MRILFVAPNVECPGTNGASTHVTEVVTRLRRSHDVLLVARRGSTLENTLGVGTPTPPKSLRGVGNRALGRVLASEVERFHPDVVYERCSEYGLGMHLARQVGVPLLALVLDGRFLPASLEAASTIITACAPLVPKEHRAKLVRVNWGANVQRFAPDLDAAPLRGTLGIGHDDVVVGHAGGFRPWQGLEHLVEAARHVDDPRVRYLLVGKGARFASVRRRVLDAGLSDRFIFAGKVPYERVPEYMAVCDVFVGPYDPKGPAALGDRLVYDPLEIFEAMAAGRAVVTAPTANSDDMFEDGRHAIFVRPADPHGLARAIRRLANEPALRAELGRAARKRVAERYTWDRHVEQLSRLLEDIRVPAAPRPTPA